MKLLRLRWHFITAALALTSVCLFSFLPSAWTQGRQDSPQGQKPQAADTLRIETELVQIDIVVTDKQGKPVTDLKREDFQVLEDGKPQPVSHFSVGTAGRQAKWLPAAKAVGKDGTPVAASPVRPVFDAGRYLVLMVDDLHLAHGNLVPAKQAMIKFMDQQVGATDQVALVTTSGALGMYEQFTADRDVLKRAINRLSLQQRTITTGIEIPHITPYQAELIDQNDPEALEMAVQELVRREGMERPQAISLSQGRARQLIAENNNVTQATLGTIENVIRGLHDLPGRKIMVLLSDGFLLGSFRDGKRYDVRRITDAATRAGVVIYSLDTRGLIAMPQSMDASQPSSAEIGPLAAARIRIATSSIEAERDGLYALAEDTGGKSFFNNNDINVGLGKVLSDTETYYLLAFEPVVSYRDGRFRKIEVRIPLRPDLKIRTRKGYFAPDDKAAEKEARAVARAEEKDKQKSPEKLAKEQQAVKDAQVSEGVTALYPLRGIPVEMVTHFINTPKEGSSLDLVAHVDAAAVKFTPVNDRFQAAVEMVGLIFNESGKSVDGFSEKIAMNLKPASLEATLKNGIIYTKQIKMNPGYYQVRFVVRQEGLKQVGSASSWIEIPDLEKNHLALSSIFFPSAEDEAQTGQREGKIPNSSANEGMKNDSVARHPAQVYHQFKRGGSFDFMVFAYNAKPNEQGATDLAVQSQIFSGNKLLLATPLRNFLDSRQGQTTSNDWRNGQSAVIQEGLAYMARLSLDQFEPGNYQLRLLVIDRNAKASAKRTINFTVE